MAGWRLPPQRKNKTLINTQGEKDAEAENKKNKNSTTEAGRVGDRPYARGRSFSEDHYAN